MLSILQEMGATAWPLDLLFFLVLGLYILGGWALLARFKTVVRFFMPRPALFAAALVLFLVLTLALLLHSSTVLLHTWVRNYQLHWLKAALMALFVPIALVNWVSLALLFARKVPLPKKPVNTLMLVLFLGILVALILEGFEWFAFLAMLAYLLVVHKLFAAYHARFTKQSFILVAVSSSILLSIALAFFFTERYKQYLFESERALLPQITETIQNHFRLRHLPEKLQEDKYIVHELERLGPKYQNIKRKIKRQYLREPATLRFDYRQAQGPAPEAQLSFRSKTNVFRQLELSMATIGYLKVAKRLYSITVEESLPLTLPRIFDPKGYLGQSFYKRNLALYRNGQLIYGGGDFNYAADFDPNNLGYGQLYSEGITLGSHRHFAQKTGDNYAVVVSVPLISLRFDFSFFAIFLFVFFIYLFGIALSYFFLFKFYNNYKDKILFYLLISFVIPLLALIIISFQIINSDFKNEFQNNAIKKTANLKTYYYENYLNRNALQGSARNSGFYDWILVYNEKGQLVFSSEKEDEVAFSPPEKLGPTPYRKVIEERENHYIDQEKQGPYQLYTVYTPILNNSGQVEAVLGLPVFESRDQYYRRIVRVLSNVVTVFILVFLIFLVLAFFSTQILTVPLNLLKHRMRRISLGENQPLEWDSEDEIGQLVREYNLMIEKLEQSRRALAQSEKENAWREMARQVAHEIKNPLTPMKLSIQHLQMRLQRMEDSEMKTRLEQSLSSLLTQVDTLSDIATSFSSFAKMPAPKMERYNLNAVLRQTTNLYATDTTIDFAFEQEWSGALYSTGDAHTMGRILTNLITNGIQAVPEGRQARVRVRLKLNSSERQALVEVEDNGEGIPEEYQHKVFVPNFSTKYAGSGIGLAVAKKGIESFGGAIWFETSAAGTTFFIRLPIEFS